MPQSNHAKVKEDLPNNTRITTEMDTVEKQSRKYELCQMSGHISKKYYPYVDY